MNACGTAVRSLCVSSYIRDILQVYDLFEMVFVVKERDSGWKYGYFHHDCVIKEK